MLGAAVLGVTLVAPAQAQSARQMPGGATGASLLAAMSAGATQAEASDVADVPAQDISIDGDPAKRYFLIGHSKDRPVPADGYRLLIVLPGGDGGEDFQAFVKRIHKNALPDGYVVAQAVAPRWSEDENRIVWPTRGLPDAAMKFSTEEFIEVIVSDVKTRCPVDSRYVFALGWSSGGPAVYASTMQQETSLTGAFVAMSVFRPDELPPAANARGRAFYLLHSPQDFIQMRFPEAARDALRGAGAAVELQTYEGGHGWRGDVFGNIRRGVEWLEKQVEERKR